MSLLSSLLGILSSTFEFTGKRIFDTNWMQGLSCNMQRNDYFVITLLYRRFPLESNNDMLSYRGSMFYTSNNKRHQEDSLGHVQSFSNYCQQRTIQSAAVILGNANQMIDWHFIICKRRFNVSSELQFQRDILMLMLRHIWIRPAHRVRRGW